VMLVMPHATRMATARRGRRRAARCDSFIE
jgi:hypothetical protein